MGGSTTLSNCFVLAAFFCVAGFTSATTSVACPHQQRVGSKIAPLTTADVFQGPPEKQASMIPDLETSEWQLAGYQENSKTRGESLYLVCRYKGTKSTVTIRIPESATSCKVVGTRHGTAAECH